MEFRLESASFGEGEAIPRRHTCQGKDVSPHLAWSGAPAAVKEYALLCDDPDAPGGSFVHWIVYNIPASTNSLPEGFSRDAEHPSGIRQGLNGWGRPGWGGPCPPSGTHRYVFTLYALDRPLGLPIGLAKDAFLRALSGRVLAEARLTGTYRKA